MKRRNIIISGSGGDYFLREVQKTFRTHHTLLLKGETYEERLVGRLGDFVGVPLIIGSQEDYDEVRTRVREFISHLKYCRTALIPPKQGQVCGEEVLGPLGLAERTPQKVTGWATPAEVLKTKARAGMLAA